MEKLRPKVAVNVFVIKNGKILLGQRKNAAGDGDWGLPGGHLEFMEHLTQGAKRELEEETGIKAIKLTFLHMINDPRTEDNSHYLHIDFIAEEYKGEPQLMEPDKCYEWKWFGFSDLPKNIFLGHQKSIKSFLDKTTLVD
jgi:8-oxo-dGTP diphosphatase